MHNEPDEKTALVRRFTRGQTGFLILLLGLVVLIFAALLTPQYTTTKLYANSHVYTLQIANSQGFQEEGLSGRASLAPSDGMLFQFPNSGDRCFWMKDMHFSLDIIWLNANKQVTYIVADASPNSYPEEFCPKTLAKYVIELNAGTAKTDGIHIGQSLRFSLTE